MSDETSNATYTLGQVKLAVTDAWIWIETVKEASYGVFWKAVQRRLLPRYYIDFAEIAAWGIFDRACAMAGVPIMRVYSSEADVLFVCQCLNDRDKEVRDDREDE